MMSWCPRTWHSLLYKATVLKTLSCPPSNGQWSDVVERGFKFVSRKLLNLLTK